MEKMLVMRLDLKMATGRHLVTKQKNHRFKTKIRSKAINRQV